MEDSQNTAKDPLFNWTEFKRNFIVNVTTLVILAISFGLRNPLVTKNYVIGNINLLAIVIMVIGMSPFRYQNLIKGVLFYVTAILSPVLTQSANTVNGLTLLGISLVFFYIQGLFQNNPVSRLVGAVFPYLIVQLVVFGIYDVNGSVAFTEFMPELGLVFMLGIGFSNRLLEERRRVPVLELGTTLTQTEMKYVYLFTKGLRSKEISYLFGISDSTVRNTLRNAVKKMKLQDTKELIRVAERNCLKFDGIAIDELFQGILLSVHGYNQKVNE